MQDLYRSSKAYSVALISTGGIQPIKPDYWQPIELDIVLASIRTGPNSPPVPLAGEDFLRTD
jgi:hypothetical protein